MNVLVSLAERLVRVPLWCWRLAFILWVIFIVCASLTTSGVSVPAFPHADKFAHAAAYAVLATLAGFSRFFSIWWVMLGCVALGALMEVLQGLFPPRTTDLFDGVANALGVFLGIIAFNYVLNFSKR